MGFKIDLSMFTFLEVTGSKGFSFEIDKLLLFFAAVFAFISGKSFEVRALGFC